MSKTETRIGKIKLISRLENETNLEFIKRTAPDYFNEEIYNKYFDEDDKESIGLFLDYVVDELPYENFVIVNDQLYEIIDDEDIAENDIFRLEDLGNGEFSYFVSYYNGGCGFGEAIEEAFRNLNDSKSKLVCSLFKMPFSSSKNALKASLVA